MIDTKRLATDAAYWDSVAPEGAEYYAPAQDHYLPCFYKKANGQTMCSLGIDDEWDYSRSGRDLADAIPRPQAPEADWKDGLLQWDGVSSPSPGELAVTSGGKCKVLGFDVQRKQVAVQWYDGEMGVITLAALKPIPTKAQRDRDELIGLIDTHQMQQGSFCTPKNMADAIIAAGWRKDQ